MATQSETVVSVVRPDEEGQISLPNEYRRKLTERGDPDVALLQVGDVLVITPCDDALNAVTERLAQKMREAGSSVQDLLQAAAEAREEVFRREFGDLNPP